MAFDDDHKRKIIEKENTPNLDEYASLIMDSIRESMLSGVMFVIAKASSSFVMPVSGSWEHSRTSMGIIDIKAKKAMLAAFTETLFLPVSPKYSKISCKTLLLSSLLNIFTKIIPEAP
jgi:hypothetical protein